MHAIVVKAWVVKGRIDCFGRDDEIFREPIRRKEAKKLYSHVGIPCAEVVEDERGSAGACGAREREARGARGALPVPQKALK